MWTSPKCQPERIHEELRLLKPGKKRTTIAPKSPGRNWARQKRSPVRNFEWRKGWLVLLAVKKFWENIKRPQLTGSDKFVEFLEEKNEQKGQLKMTSSWHLSIPHGFSGIWWRNGIPWIFARETAGGFIPVLDDSEIISFFKPPKKRRRGEKGDF